MRMAERHAELDEQRQADEWAAYLEWEAAELQLNELQGEQYVDLRETATSTH